MLTHRVRYLTGAIAIIACLVGGSTIAWSHIDRAKDETVITFANGATLKGFEGTDTEDDFPSTITCDHSSEPFICRRAANKRSDAGNVYVLGQEWISASPQEESIITVNYASAASSADQSAVDARTLACTLGEAFLRCVVIEGPFIPRATKTGIYHAQS